MWGGGGTLALTFRPENPAETLATQASHVTVLRLILRFMKTGSTYRNLGPLSVHFQPRNITSSHELPSGMKMK